MPCEQAEQTGQGDLGGFMTATMVNEMTRGANAASNEKVYDADGSVCARKFSRYILEHSEAHSRCYQVCFD